MTASMNGANAGTARILVVDDDPQVAEVLSLALTSAGYGTILAGSGEECLSLALSEQPELILLDVRLPGMDGNSTASRLSREPGTRNIPVVMMTGDRETADRIKALESGAVDFLLKPLSAVELVAKVRSLVRLKAYNDEAERKNNGLMAQVAGKTGQLEEALKAFSRFVPGEFLSCLGKESIVDVVLGDQMQAEMSILFADIRAFTAMSEKMLPAETFSFLNAYLGKMNPCIWENGGYIDKYIGDAIMALFPTGPGAALDAAIAMLKQIPVFNAHRALFGHDPVAIGIGVNTGTVMLGIIGHERFMQGTVISDAVNLASRLESLTKAYGVELIISKYVLFALDDPNKYQYRFLDTVMLKGKTDTVPVYEVFNADPPDLAKRKADTREVFEKGVYEFHSGRYSEAMEIFETLPLDGADRPLAIYRERCLAALAKGGVGQGRTVVEVGAYG